MLPIPVHWQDVCASKPHGVLVLLHCDAGGAKSPGIGWPLAFIMNYVEANGTATMLCPGFHGWNQNLGRHNHG